MEDNLQVKKEINTEKGIILCAVGNAKYYNMCNTIIHDIKEVMPHIPVAVYTDNFDKISDADIYIKGEHKPEKVFWAKIKTCQITPFEKSIFIDVDSRVLLSIEHLFELLIKHDIGLTYAQVRSKESINWNPSYTGLFLCSSTLIFNKNLKIKDLFIEWENDYLLNQRFPGKGDQHYLRYLIYHHENIRYFVLPDEYHLNSDFPSYVAGTVKIVTSLITDKDPRGKISRSQLDKIINYKNTERLIYFDLIGGWRYKKISRYIPQRILVKQLYKYHNKNVKCIINSSRMLLKKLKIF